MDYAWLLERIEFLLDRAKIQRWKTTQYDSAIELASDRILDEYSAQVRSAGYGIQEVQKVRDALYPLIVDEYPMQLIGFFYLKTLTTQIFPDDFKLLLNVFITVNGKQFEAIPIRNNELINLTNPNKKPNTQFELFYWKESKDGLRIYTDEFASLTDGKISYLKRFNKPDYTNPTDFNMPQNTFPLIADYAASILTSIALNSRLNEK